MASEYKLAWHVMCARARDCVQCIGNVCEFCMQTLAGLEREKTTDNNRNCLNLLFRSGLFFVSNGQVNDSIIS